MGLGQARSEASAYPLGFASLADKSAQLWSFRQDLCPWGRSLVAVLWRRS